MELMRSLAVFRLEVTNLIIYYNVSFLFADKSTFTNLSIFDHHI